MAPPRGGIPRVHAMRGKPRELDGERRAFPDRALELDPAAMRLDDLARDVQPETEPQHTSRGDRALESLEDPGVSRRRDPYPTIGGNDPGPVRLAHRVHARGRGSHPLAHRGQLVHGVSGGAPQDANLELHDSDRSA